MAAKPSKPAAPAKQAAAGRPDKAAKAEKTTKPDKAGKAKAAFPKKNHPPTEAEFLARLPLPVGKKFEGVRTFLTKHGVVEDLYFYGPKTGWAFRYRRGSHSLATVTLHGDRLVGIVALDAAAQGEVDFTALSEVGEQARRFASGSPSLVWLDLPLGGHGAADFRVLLKAKLKTLPAAQPVAAPPPPPPPPKKKAT